MPCLCGHHRFRPSQALCQWHCHIAGLTATPRVLRSGVWHCVLFAGERRWVVTDIIGVEDGLGVENLSGSAAIGTLFCRCAL